jgi:hypothetical protein
VFLLSSSTAATEAGLLFAGDLADPLGAPAAAQPPLTEVPLNPRTAIATAMPAGSATFKGPLLDFLAIRGWSSSEAGGRRGIKP